jgi:hypothetical protein
LSSGEAAAVRYGLAANSSPKMIEHSILTSSYQKER